MGWAFGNKPVEDAIGTWAWADFRFLNCFHRP
jgi:hypothetical protein